MRLTLVVVSLVPRPHLYWSGYETNAPINGMPHLPVLGARWGEGGDLPHFCCKGRTPGARTACQILYQPLISPPPGVNCFKLLLLQKHANPPSPPPVSPRTGGWSIPLIGATCSRGYSCMATLLKYKEP